MIIVQVERRFDFEVAERFAVGIEHDTVETFAGWELKFDFSVRLLPSKSDVFANAERVASPTICLISVTKRERSGNPCLARLARTTQFARKETAGSYRSQWASLAAGGVTIRELSVDRHLGIVALPTSRFLAAQIDASLNDQGDPGL